jgi:hypothetical protein
LPTDVYRFVKSSYSNTTDDCVEVAARPRGAVVRDGKVADGPLLWFPGPAWRELLAAAPGQGSS